MSGTSAPSMPVGIACEQCGADTMNPRRKKFCHDCAPMDRINGKGEGTNQHWLATIRNYGVDADMWNAMYFEQDGQCVICHDNEAKVVDHCHETGRVRALLCQSCNAHLGWLETMGGFERALEYVEEGSY